jgi:hypothetical protein
VTDGSSPRYYRAATIAFFLKVEREFGSDTKLKSGELKIIFYSIIAMPLYRCTTNTIDR